MSSHNLELPVSTATVNVRLIDTTSRVHSPTAALIKNPLPGHEKMTSPSFVFLIEHPTGKKVLYDLGVRKDQHFPPFISSRIQGIFSMDVEKDVADILTDHEINLSDISSIIWSHWHFDHSGDPSTFPGSTELVVGPGFKNAFVPGYPENPNGLIHTSDYEGRNLREIEFDDAVRIGQFRAFDFFGDGSFYILDAPGHTIGHISALARTTPDSFVFMGGDACHHCGALRPTEKVPLPDELSPSPLSEPPHLEGTVCPGALLEAVHPNLSRTEPFYPQVSESPDRNVQEAEATIDRLRLFDSSEDVFVVIAHDKGLLDVVDLFPKSINGWKQNRWKETGRWRFLEDFGHAAKLVK